MHLLDQIKIGMVDLSADRGDRFAFMIGGHEIPINYVKSTGLGKVKMATKVREVPLDETFKQNGNYCNRNFSILKNGKLTPRQDIFLSVCHMVIIEIFSTGSTMDINFKIKTMALHPDELWMPNKISTGDDVFMEVVEIEVYDIGKGIN